MNVLQQCAAKGAVCQESIIMLRNNLNDYKLLEKKDKDIAYYIPAITWGLCCQKKLSQAEIINYIPQFTAGCYYLSLHEKPASHNKVHISSVIITGEQCTYFIFLSSKPFSPKGEAMVLTNECGCTLRWLLWFVSTSEPLKNRRTVSR